MGEGHRQTAVAALYGEGKEYLERAALLSSSQMNTSKPEEYHVQSPGGEEKNLSM